MAKRIVGRPRTSAKEKPSGLVSAIMGVWRFGQRLVVDELALSTDLEKKLARIMVEETERARETQRGKDSVLGLEGDIDYADTIDFGELLADPTVLLACSSRSGRAEAEVLTFAIEKLGARNWRELVAVRRLCEWQQRDVLNDIALARAVVEKKLRGEYAQARKEHARHAANIKHDKPDGARARRQRLQARWATGVYSTRDACAEAEWKVLGYNTFGTARKALRNSPDPT